MLTCYKNRIQLTNFKGPPAVLGRKPVHYKTKLIQSCLQTVLKTKVKEVFFVTNLRVVVHRCPAVPTDANKTDGMASSKSASFITDRKKKQLYIFTNFT